MSKNYLQLTSKYILPGLKIKRCHRLGTIPTSFSRGTQFASPWLCSGSYRILSLRRWELYMHRVLL